MSMAGCVDSCLELHTKLMLGQYRGRSVSLMHDEVVVTPLVIEYHDLFYNDTH